MDFQRVAVTGGCGRLGRFVVAELARHARVTVIDRAVAEIPAAETVVALDVRDGAALARTIAGHDAIVHLAALDLAVEAAESQFFETNVLATWAVLWAAEETGVAKVAIASSNSAYGLSCAAPRVPPVSLPIDEDHPLRPSHAYAVGKVASEEIARAFARRGAVETVALRPMLVMRPGLATEVAGLMAALGTGAIGEDDPRVAELPLLASYVRPDDAARCFRLALAADGAPFEVFNVAAADSFAAEPTLDLVARRFGGLPEIKCPRLFAENPRAAAFDSRRARERLGWQPTGDWAATLAADRA